MSPHFGCCSSRNLLDTWYNLSGSDLYERAHVEASEVTASSCVGAKTRSRPWLSFVLSNSVPMESHRPLAFHSPAGVSIGSETLWAPTEAMESSMRSVSFRMDL